MRAQIGFAIAFVAIAATTVGWSQQSKTKSATNQSRTTSRADVIEKISTSVLCIQVSLSYSTSVPAHDNQPATIANLTGTYGGTGFVIDGEWHIATANHVIDAEVIEKDVEKQEKDQGRTLVQGSFQLGRIGVKAMVPTVEGANGPMIYAGSMMVPGTVIKQDKVRDIAILSAPTLGHVVVLHMNGKDIRATIASLQTQKPRAGDAVSVSGFPAFLGTGQIPVLTTDSGTISTSTLEYQPNFFVYLANLHVNHGDSGGPVFNDNDGRVIGMVDAFLNAREGGNSGESVIIPIREILKLVPQSSQN